MAGPGEINNNSQPFKLTIESFNRPANAAVNAANAPQQLANAQPAPHPQPVVTLDFVIDFTGAEPVIRDVKIGQALSA